MTTTTDLLSHCEEAVRSAEQFLAAAKSRVSAKVGRDGRVDGAKLDAEQHAAHGLAWLATYVEAVRQLRGTAGPGQVADVEVVVACGAGSGAQYHNTAVLGRWS